MNLSLSEFDEASLFQHAQSVPSSLMTGNKIQSFLQGSSPLFLLTKAIPPQTQQVETVCLVVSIKIIFEYLQVRKRHGEVINGDMVILMLLRIVNQTLQPLLRPLLITQCSSCQRLEIDHIRRLVIVVHHIFRLFTA